MRQDFLQTTGETRFPLSQQTANHPSTQSRCQQQRTGFVPPQPHSGNYVKENKTFETNLPHV